MAITMMSDMIDPQVLAAMVSAQLPKAIRFANVSPVDTTLEGRPGDTITLPKFVYTGKAEQVDEAQPIDYNKLQTTEQSVKVRKLVSAYEVTDETLKSAYGDPASEVARQMRMALADAMDEDIVETAKNAKLKVNKVTATPDLIDSIETVFSGAQDAIEDYSYPQQGIIFLSYHDAALIRKNATQLFARPSELGDNVLVNGAFGELLGWELIRTARLQQGEAIAVKPGALKTFMKSSIDVRYMYDMDTQVNKYSATEYFANAIVDESKVAHITNLIDKGMLISGGTSASNNSSASSNSKPSSTTGISG